MNDMISLRCPFFVVSLLLQSLVITGKTVRCILNWSDENKFGWWLVKSDRHNLKKKPPNEMVLLGFNCILHEKY